VVYVDNDPIVLAHAHYLLKSVEPGGTRYIQADLRDTGSIIDQAADFLDLSQPVAVMLVGLLHHFRDEDDPYRLVARLMEAVPSGSYLAMSHLAIDIMPEAMAAAAVHLNEAMEEPWIPRTHAGVAKFFEGLEPVDPGVVQVDEWRNPDAPPPPPGWTNPLYVGVGRKP
jgi:O-methyltransferase involved in polyketide biosynthesis